MKDKPLCDSCKRYLMSDTCTIPYKDNYTEWVKTKDTLSEDGSCDYYDKKSLLYIIKEYVMGWVYFFKNKYEAVYYFIKYKLILYAKYQFDIRDTFNLGDSISTYIEPRLNYFINNNRHGVPTNIWNEQYIKTHDLERYYEFEINSENLDSDVDENYDRVFTAWNKILNKIYRAVYINNHRWDIENYDDENYNPYTPNEDVDEGLRLLGLFMLNIWD